MHRMVNSILGEYLATLVLSPSRGDPSSRSKGTVPFLNGSEREKGYNDPCTTPVCGKGNSFDSHPQFDAPYQPSITRTCLHHARMEGTLGGCIHVYT